MTRPAELIRARDLSLELLAALSRLSAGEREAWIDWHVLGVAGATRDSRKQLRTNANRRLREIFGSSDGLRERAA